MKKTLLLLLFSLSLFANQKAVLQLMWQHQFQFAGYYMAKELGYYKDAGIDLEIRPYDFSINLVSAIENKEVDFAIGRSSLLIHASEGKDIVALGALFQHSPLMLILRDDSGINTIEELKGKRIMLSHETKDSASILAMLSSKGLTQKEIQLPSHSFDLENLINGKADAMAAYVSNEPFIMADRGIGYKIFHPKDYGFDFYSDILFTSSAFIKKNPKLTEEFYEATLKGWKYAFEHIVETAELIHRHYNTQNKTLLQLIREAESLKHLVYSGEKPLGYLDKSRLKEIIKVYQVLGVATKDIDLDSFVYEHNHPKKLLFSFDYDEIFYLLLIAVLLLIGLGSVVIFISLERQWLHTQNDLKRQISLQKEKIEKQNSLIMAQSKMAAVGEMLSNIAHQWRQPLNIISLNTVKMETGALLGKPLNDEELASVTKEINRQAQYLSQTIDDFRSYFNADTQSIAPFNLKEAVQKVTDLTKDLFASHFIETVITVDDYIIEHNESLFVQALLNIYNNAVDAITQTNPTQRYFFVDLKHDEKKLILSLKDSGGGISKEVMDKIFEPYFSTKHATKGTGLGLYITYEIVTKHLNGTAEVRNTSYNYNGQSLKGAEFILTLPPCQ
ncbi:MAG: ABC transporter substrate-binding protein [Campylobacterales bacterium]|nr:ABC transporter substrate-binding protein [Campylobacterales bacterium]